MLDLLFPPRCVICRRPGDQLCRGCIAGLRRIPPPICERCGAPTVWPVRRCGDCAGRRLAFASARSAIVYDEAARTLIRAWKERGLRALAAAVADLVVEVVPRPEADAVVGVPPDRDRALSRGPHPTVALARALASRWQLGVDKPIRRTGARPRQAGLPRDRRRANVRLAFAPVSPAPRRVCLVDDVYTSGETVDAAASALRRAGAVRVHVVSVARAVR